MPRYYFDFRDARGVTEDEVGEDLPSFNAARTMALVTLGEVARDVALNSQEGQITIEVRDANGLILAASATIEVHPLKR